MCVQRPVYVKIVTKDRLVLTHKRQDLLVCCIYIYMLPQVYKETTICKNSHERQTCSHAQAPGLAGLSYIHMYAPSCVWRDQYMQKQSQKTDLYSRTSARTCWYVVYTYICSLLCVKRHIDTYVWNETQKRDLCARASVRTCWYVVYTYMYAPSCVERDLYMWKEAQKTDLCERSSARTRWYVVCTYICSHMCVKRHIDTYMWKETQKRDLCARASVRTCYHVTYTYIHALSCV